VGTSVTDAVGLGQFLDANTTGVPQKFCRVSDP
jgi:hypothetical protein